MEDVPHTRQASEWPENSWQAKLSDNRKIGPVPWKAKPAWAQKVEAAAKKAGCEPVYAACAKPKPKGPPSPPISSSKGGQLLIAKASAAQPGGSPCSSTSPVSSCTAMPQNCKAESSAEQPDSCHEAAQRASTAKSKGSLAMENVPHKSPAFQWDENSWQANLSDSRKIGPIPWKAKPAWAQEVEAAANKARCERVYTAYGKPKPTGLPPKELPPSTPPSSSSSWQPKAPGSAH